MFCPIDHRELSRKGFSLFLLSCRDGITRKAGGDPGPCARSVSPAVPTTPPAPRSKAPLLTFPKFVLLSSWFRAILISLQVVVTGGTEHRGSLSDCSRSVFTSLRLVSSCAIDFLRSFKALFVFNRASLVSLITVETQSALEPQHLLDCQWQNPFSSTAGP